MIFVPRFQHDIRLGRRDSLLHMRTDWPCEVSWVNRASGSTTKVAQSVPSLSAYGSQAGHVAVPREMQSVGMVNNDTNLIVVGPNIKPLRRDHVRVFCGCDLES